MRNITGSLDKRNGRYHVVISFYDREGKRRKKSRTTNLRVNGNNKRKAAIIMNELVTSYRNKADFLETGEMMFTDLMLEWLEHKKMTIRGNTYEAYERNIRRQINSYFEPFRIKICDLKPLHIQRYYDKELEKGLSANTIGKRHVNICAALKYAVCMGMIPTNPARNVELPKKVKYKADFYGVEMINLLYAKIEGDKIEVPVKTISYYGLRRSEVLGLRWRVIDFENKEFEINHTCILVKSKMVYVDATKNDSSRRKLPLTDDFCFYLKEVKRQQEVDKKKYGLLYKDSDYICRLEDGTLINPDYLTHQWKIFVEQDDELKNIRLHDLRHSSASLLLKAGCSLKEIQDWLGHADINTTANIYSHLLFETKVEVGNKVEAILKIN